MSRHTRPGLGRMHRLLEEHGGNDVPRKATRAGFPVNEFSGVCTAWSTASTASTTGAVVVVVAGTVVVVAGGSVVTVVEAWGWVVTVVGTVEVVDDATGSTSPPPVERNRGDGGQEQHHESGACEHQDRTGLRVFTLGHRDLLGIGRWLWRHRHQPVGKFLHLSIV